MHYIMSHQDLVLHMSIGVMEKISVTFLSCVFSSYYIFICVLLKLYFYICNLIFILYEHKFVSLITDHSIKKIHQIEVFLFIDPSNFPVTSLILKATDQKRPLCGTCGRHPYRLA